MTTYIFPFEYVSLVLLVAMIGAAILIREHQTVATATTPRRPRSRTQEVAS